tara:strand:+ start:1062 stop:1451 length:390 start_codon:yes stop_codon:yes gene_type:complete
MGAKIKEHVENKDFYQTLYGEMRLHFTDECWACGESDQPGFWYAPWFLHRAHIVSQPRLKDRRCVVLLCPLCHSIEHGAKHLEAPRKPLRTEHLLWLKKKHDPEFYDLTLLQECSVRILPKPKEYGSCF